VRTRGAEGRLMDREPKLLALAREEHETRAVSAVRMLEVVLSGYACMGEEIKLHRLIGEDDAGFNNCDSGFNHSGSFVAADDLGLRRPPKSP